MSLAMENLSAIRRGKAIYYSFLAARSKLFYMIDNGHLSSAMHFLAINIIDCTVQERLSLQDRLPSNF